MKSAKKTTTIPFGLLAVYAMGLMLIALNLKNYLLN